MKAPARTRAGSAKTGARDPRTAQFITYRIGLLAKLLDRGLMPWLSEQFDLSLAEWRAMTFLYASPPETVRELANRMRVDKAEVSRACAELVRRGYVRRGDDPHDARSVLFSMTASGRKLHDAILPLRQAVQDEMAAVLTKTERAALFSAVDKLMAHLLVTNAGRRAGR